MTVESAEAVLITGGAGYIGSHVVLALADKGRPVVVVDDLSTGRRGAVPDSIPFYEGKVEDGDLVAQIIREHHCRAAMHFAGSIVVPESVARPLDYYENNVVASVHLLRTCVENGIDQFVFSSTAAVYDGDGPHGEALDEDARLAPANPYGRGKLMTENILGDVAAATGLNVAILRYFNVAGADPDGRSGQYGEGASHLIRRACQTVLGSLPHIDVFGDDYATADGTCVRDYIHVSDLAQAHISVLDHVRANGENVTFNCGYGHGYSVAEVLDVVDQVAAETLNARPMARRPAPRRPGDPASLIADTGRIRQTLNWQPRYDDLAVMARTALLWEKALLEGLV